jgi:hypothetical protein
MSTVEIIVLVLAALALIVIIGWRYPERKPINRDEEID